MEYGFVIKTTKLNSYTLKNVYGLAPFLFVCVLYQYINNRGGRGTVSDHIVVIEGFDPACQIEPHQGSGYLLKMSKKLYTHCSVLNVSKI